MRLVGVRQLPIGWQDQQRRAILATRARRLLDVLDVEVGIHQIRHAFDKRRHALAGFNLSQHQRLKTGRPLQQHHEQRAACAAEIGMPSAVRGGVFIPCASAAGAVAAIKAISTKRMVVSETPVRFRAYQAAS
ncbi:MAG: hypothetical protein KBF30_09140 [Hyphomonadaceae bacterium]|nr:hypothetical protein [Hyphomonadaceae bacterium]